jgi:hypothetical protein
VQGSSYTYRKGERFDYPLRETVLHYSLEVVVPGYFSRISLGQVSQLGVKCPGELQNEEFLVFPINEVAIWSLPVDHSGENVTAGLSWASDPFPLMSLVPPCFLN